MDAVTGREKGGVLPDGLGAAIRGTAADIAALLEPGTDTRRRIPGAEWNVGEAAAHLASANVLMADIAEGRPRPYGDGTPQSLAEANARSLAEFTERAPAPLAAMIVDGAEACVRALETQDAPPGPVVSPLGPMSRPELGSYLLTHMLGHGYDLARALRRPHMVGRDRAALALPFLLRAMPRVAEASRVEGMNARYAVRLWGGGDFGVVVADGALSVAARPSDRPDCTIHIEPVTFLLMALGRQGQVGPLLRGRILVRGRRPWLAPRFPGLFTAP
ncbi:maleylpyruvate isomerase family mycothiol-dependent enzyme [Streptomyces sp. NPDC048566]|uniref:maleylpyruvate isomerase family mycothiol-dependent enzyme n=1 Tax=Streptomyces sp. NPDC048566 TaxID=3365569 RepID=UPI003720591C